MSLHKSVMALLLRLGVVVVVVVIVGWMPRVDGAGHVFTGRPLYANADVPWQDLADTIGDTTGTLLVTPSVERWRSECLTPFENPLNGTFFTTYFFSDYEDGGKYVSNHRLYEAADGTCMCAAMCVYDNCFAPGQDPPHIAPFSGAANLKIVPGETYIPTTDPDLPARVMFPRSVADIQAAIEFCTLHKVGITIKVAGSSLVGASSHGGTLLLKMTTNFPDYADNGSIELCNAWPADDNVTAYGMACTLARARNAPAVIRVGGGELFDQAYRAVFITYNSANPTAPLHMVGGGSGTVAAAGGWTASGGLSGNGGMRMYGFGSDQVVAIEMVLPNGEHVYFGPSEWEEKIGYPRTTKVTGYCNSNPVANETLWEWGECDPALNIKFEDLWFAVRGGGGGTWGVVTSYYYNLHSYPGTMEIVAQDPTPFIGINMTNGALLYTINSIFLKFSLSFLYTPEDFGITQERANLCNSPFARMEFFSIGFYWCYDGMGTVMAESWDEFLDRPDIISQLEAVGVDDAMRESYKDLFYPLVLPGFASSEIPNLVIPVIEYEPNRPVPQGLVQDIGPAGFVPEFSYGAYPAFDVQEANLLDMRNVHFPREVVENRMDELIAIMAEETLFEPGGSTYMLGGFIRDATDGMTALPSHRREGAFFRSTKNPVFAERYLDLFYNSTAEPYVGGPEFPGRACHNHGLTYEYGPLKNDWTKVCPIDWSLERKYEECISVPESYWGTANANKLAMIKTEVDPDGIFVCNMGVGWDYTADFATPVTPAPAGTPTPPTPTPPTPTPPSPTAPSPTTGTDAPTGLPSSNAATGSLLPLSVLINIITGLMLSFFSL